MKTMRSFWVTRPLLTCALALMACATAYATTTTDYIVYGTTGAVTCTGLSTEGSSLTSAVSCTPIDNTSALAVDVMVYASITTSASALADKIVYVYASGSFDGSSYEQDESSSPASGGAYTVNNPPGFRLVASITSPNTSKTYTKAFTLANAYGGVLPQKISLIFVNDTGQALTGASVSYCPINYKNQ